MSSPRAFRPPILSLEHDSGQGERRALHSMLLSKKITDGRPAIAGEGDAAGDVRRSSEGDLELEGCFVCQEFFILAAGVACPAGHFICDTCLDKSVSAQQREGHK
jgi:hypothetical protein